MKRYLIITTLILSTAFEAVSQFKLTAEIRPRSELRRGFATLSESNSDAAFFTSQRSRLIFDYTKESKLRLFINVQDIRVWGDSRQLVRDDGNRTSLHEGWAELFLTDKVSLKFGRQEISLNDHRIFGNVGWAQQARAHDAMLLKYNNNGFSAQLGGAFNQTGETLFSTLYELNNYKTLQYLWLNKKWEKLDGSFLFLNNGLQFVGGPATRDDETRFSQTMGTHLIFKPGTINLTSNLFYQFGKDVNDRDISAYLASLDARINLREGLFVGAGFELISGTNSNETGDNNSFSPFYGTNHKFNGWMDYFFVGNHADNIGLFDAYVYGGVSKGKFSGRLYIHNFTSPADNITTDGLADGQLGLEADLEITYVLNPDVNFKWGYSQLFASEGMEALKGGVSDTYNGWSWLMITVKPTIFQTKDD